MGFLREIISDEGNQSCMRFLAIYGLFTASIIAILGMVMKSDLNQVITLCSIFTAGSFTGKLLQKWMEIKDK